jgi:hypothetical protein
MFTLGGRNIRRGKYPDILFLRRRIHAEKIDPIIYLNGVGGNVLFIRIFRLFAG